MERRWEQHVWHAATGGGYALHRAIRKYGADAFGHEVLEIATSIDSGNAAEIKWISHFGSADHERGYNILMGGDGFMCDTETLSKRALARASNMTAEERSAIARKGMVVRSEESRHHIAKVYAALSPERRRVMALIRQSALGPELRSEAARKANAARTPEQRSASASKRWEKRREDPAALAASNKKTADAVRAYAASRTLEEKRAINEKAAKSRRGRTPEEKASSEAKRQATLAARRASGLRVGRPPGPKKVPSSPVDRKLRLDIGDGTMVTLKELAALVGLTYGGVIDRLRRGASAADILAHPGRQKPGPRRTA